MPSQKEYTPEELVARYRLLQARQINIQQELAALREAAKGICDHSIGSEWKQDQDDGYGRWWKVDRRRCDICGQKFHRYGSGEWRKSDD